MRFTLIHNYISTFSYMVGERKSDSSRKRRKNMLPQIKSIKNFLKKPRTVH